MTRVPKLSAEEIVAKLSGLSGWTVVGDQLEKKYKFKNFVQSLAFVNQVAAEAEAANHHPSITIHFNQVILQWVTWGAHGITDLDFQLAARCDALLPPAEQ